MNVTATRNGGGKPTSESLRHPSRPSLLAQIEHAYRQLGARGLRLTAAGEPITLGRIQLRHLHPSTTQAERDAIWASIVHRARADPDWKIAALGLAMPGLRRAIRVRLHGPAMHEHDDVHADLVAGFLEHLRRVDCTRPNICGRLIDAGVRQARYQQRRRWRDARELIGFDRPGRALYPPSLPHPRDVVAVLTAWQAALRAPVRPRDLQLIVLTRHHGYSLAEAAGLLGITSAAAASRRLRAEARLTGRHGHAHRGNSGRQVTGVG
jgi:DNA-directed RNA polymerase specialized sigma24 family protein